MQWIMKWKLYLFFDSENDSFMKKAFYNCFDPPGIIDNSILLEDDGSFNKNAELVKF